MASAPRPWTALAALALLAPGALGASLTAGDVDDHLNWEQYLAYLGRLGDRQGQALPGVDLGDRVTLRIVDDEGRALPHVVVVLTPEGAAEPRVRLVAGTDGLVRFFPRSDGLGQATRLATRVEAPGAAPSAHLLDLAALPADRSATLVVEGAEPALPKALDLMIVIDTTGSMSDELHYLTAELPSIVGAIVAAHPGVDLRLGLMLYRDEGDAYVVRDLGFTPDLQRLQGWLAEQRAEGGGDEPEAMDRALEAAVRGEWRGPEAARILLLVADAPPHPGGHARFLEAAERARAEGIHVYPLAASGASPAAEYLMRAAAVLTQGRYLFLTDDSGLGSAHAEPTVACYLVTTLDDLLVRIVQGELTGQRVEPAEAQVVRRVGAYERGVCLGDLGPAPEGQERPATSPPATGSGPTGAGDIAATSTPTGGRPSGGDALMEESSAPRSDDGPSDARASAAKTAAPALPLVLAALGLVAVFVRSRRRARPPAG